MSFTLYMPAFVDDVSVIPAAYLNKMRVDSSRAIDGTAGGAYAPAADIVLSTSSIQLAGVLRLKYVARPVTRRQPMLGNLGANYAHSTGELIVEQTIAGGEFIISLTNLPNGAVLDSVTVGLKGAAGHANDPVTATLPVVTVRSQDGIGGGPVPLGLQADTSADRATYEAFHTITVAGIAHTIDLTTYTYDVEIDGEVAGDWVVGCEFYAVSVICTVSDQSEY